MKSRVLIGLFGMLWIAGVLFGMQRLTAYEVTPGASAEPAPAWPAASSVPLSPQKHTLVLVAHPQCPCTRATIGELSALMARCEGLLDVHVLFYKPKGAEPGWEKSGLWRSAAAIPGVRVVSDLDGAEASRFDGLTSGQTLLFNPAGELLFKGGITAGRGHAGENAGRNAIVSLVKTGRAARSETPVFGCQVREDGAAGA